MFYYKKHCYVSEKHKIIKQTMLFEVNLQTVELCTWRLSHKDAFTMEILGNAEGESLAFSDDFNDGKEDGTAEGALEGFVEGISEVESLAFSDGFNVGVLEGISEGESLGWSKGLIEILRVLSEEEEAVGEEVMFAAPLAALVRINSSSSRLERMRRVFA